MCGSCGWERVWKGWPNLLCRFALWGHVRCLNLRSTQFIRCREYRPAVNVQLVNPPPPKSCQCALNGTLIYGRWAQRAACTCERSHKQKLVLPLLSSVLQCTQRHGVWFCKTERSKASLKRSLRGHTLVAWVSPGQLPCTTQVATRFVLLCQARNTKGPGIASA